MKGYLFTGILLMIAIIKLVAFFLYPNKEVSLFGTKTEPWIYGLVWGGAGILSLLGIINQYRNNKL